MAKSALFLYLLLKFSRDIIYFLEKLFMINCNSIICICIVGIRVDTDVVCGFQCSRARFILRKHERFKPYNVDQLT